MKYMTVVIHFNSVLYFCVYTCIVASPPGPSQLFFTCRKKTRGGLVSKVT